MYPGMTRARLPYTTLNRPASTLPREHRLPRRSVSVSPFEGTIAQTSLSSVTRSRIELFPDYGNVKQITSATTSEQRASDHMRLEVLEPRVTSGAVSKAKSFYLEIWGQLRSTCSSIWHIFLHLWHATPVLHLSVSWRNILGLFSPACSEGGR